MKNNILYSFIYIGISIVEIACLPATTMSNECRPLLCAARLALGRPPWNAYGKYPGKFGFSVTRHAPLDQGKLMV